MIRFALTCENEHKFESWFRSGEDFDRLSASGQIACTVCGSSSVTKSLMAPPVPKKGERKEEVAPTPMATGADAEMQQAIEKLREHVEANSDYVGDRFADEARSMHLGDTPNRAIYGETTPEEARSLAEDGVPALPLPFRPTRKTN